MKKIFLYTVAFLCLLACVGIVSFKFLFVPVLVHNMDNFVAQINSPLFSVRYDKVEDTCMLTPCVRLDNLQIDALDYHLNAGTVQIEMPFKFPLSVSVKTISDESSDVFVDADLSRNALDVKKLDWKMGDFAGALSGSLDTTTQQITGSMQTVNLKKMMTRYIPKDMQFLTNMFLMDSLQTWQLSNHNGWVSAGNFPLFSLKSLRLDLIQFDDF